jgi:low affinity Fe/Cu permease
LFLPKEAHPVATKISPRRGFGDFLERVAHEATVWTGSTWGFVIACLVILLWVISGPLFRYSDTWQLVINTSTTIVTFLMVFLIQRAQNKESLAMQLKLNEILASLQGASNRLINIEDLGEEEICDLHERYRRLVERVQRNGDVCGAHTIEEARRLRKERRD